MDGRGWGESWCLCKLQCNGMMGDRCNATAGVLMLWSFASRLLYCGRYLQYLVIGKGRLQWRCLQNYGSRHFGFYSGFESCVARLALFPKIHKTFSLAGSAGREFNI